MAALDGSGRKQLLFGLAVLALAGIALAAHWYFTSGERQAGTEDPQRAVQAKMQEVTFLHGEQGAEVWRLKAVEARLGQNRDVVALAEPDMRYFFEDNHTLSATSAKGKYNRNNRTAAFWPEVSGSYGSVRFTAGRMEYAASTENIVLSEGVHVTRGNTSIRSSRAQLELGRQRVTFSRDAEVELGAERE
ncbi:MAG: LPS export ABC transporter periplasmic protein LptC [Desulfohalobiaceae bacterium]